MAIAGKNQGADKAAELAAQMEAAKQEQLKKEQAAAATEGSGQSEDNGDSENNPNTNPTAEELARTLEGQQPFAETTVVLAQGTEEKVVAAINAIPAEQRAGVYVKLDDNEKDPAAAIQAAYDKTLIPAANAVPPVPVAKPDDIPAFNSKEDLEPADAGASGSIVQTTESAPVAEVPVEKPAPAIVGSTLEFPAHFSGAGKAALRTIKSYVAAMALNKPMTEENGIPHQVMLYRALVAIINRSGNDFSEVLTEVLKIVHENRESSFSEIAVYRFMSNITLSQDEIKTFQRLLNMLILTCDPKGRKAGLKHVDLAATMGVGTIITEEGRQRVMNFFGK